MARGSFVEALAAGREVGELPLYIGGE